MASTVDGWSWKDYMVGTSIAVGVATASYLVYFDYKRRNDPSFRNTIKKQRKAAIKAKAEEEAARAKSRAAAAAGTVSDGPDKVPTNIEEKEKYFMDQLQSGEILYRKGPAHFQAAASCFMKAMRVYPQPLELIGLFQKSLPEPVFQLLMEMMAAEVRKEEEEVEEVLARQLESGGRNSGTKNHSGYTSSSSSPTRPAGRTSISITTAGARRDDATRAAESAVEDLLHELMGNDDEDDEWEDEEDGGGDGARIQVLE
ncbi:hypothetical protein SeLEV6574_g04971 [Synchytrium endobioticum]|uniref:Mitochondrial import receptor subunit TOM20 n=1 Tax=Synchytrium endobioticum TaxID=286115 RepID=A0A507CX17_9FUNG|nr:hypothetical protein SeLEV6574_g04971 [Synchytrium endobioticum]